MGKNQILRSCYALMSICLGVAACSSSDQGGIAFHGERAVLPGLSVDTGYQPAASPVQVKFTLSSGGGLTADARASVSDGNLTPIAGSGQYALAASVKAEASVKIDYSGIKYDGVLKQIEFTVPAAQTTFEPFLLDTKASIATDIPEMPLPSIPLAGVPGAGGTLELSVSGHIDSTFTGVCAKARDGVAQITGKTATFGTLKLNATVKLEIPIIGTKSFGPFPIMVNIPPLEIPLDLGQRNLADGSVAMASPSPCEEVTTCKCTDGQVCIEGKCAAPPTCNATNCASGCCQGNTCVTGDVNSACGGGGLACQTCGSGQACTGKRCALGCSSMSCGGCCDAMGQCKDGFFDSLACGLGGKTCSACASGFACYAGSCVDTSCSATCSGCCVGSTCRVGNAADECGAMGNACVGCGTGRSCVSGRCEVVADSTLWDFVVQAVTVEPTTCDGTPWDPFGGLPDPYVIATVGTGSAAQNGTTASVSNSVSASFNQTVLTGLAAGLVKSGLGLTVYDYDGVGDDLMGSQSFATPIDVFNGLQSKKFGACPSSSPVTVYYSLKPH